MYIFHKKYSRYIFNGNGSPARRGSFTENWGHVKLMRKMTSRKISFALRAQTQIGRRKIVLFHRKYLFAAYNKHPVIY